MALSIEIQGRKLTQPQLDAIVPVLNLRIQKRMGKAKFEQACIEALRAGGVPLQDYCQVCNGTRGGVPGNENVLDGVIMCDYCSADRLRVAATQEAAE